MQTSTHVFGSSTYIASFSNYELALTFNKEQFDLSDLKLLLFFIFLLNIPPLYSSLVLHVHLHTATVDNWMS